MKYPRLLGGALLSLLVVVLVLFALERNPPVHDPALLLALLNSAFAGVLPVLVAWFGARTYLRTGATSVLLMGAGMLAFGLGSVAAGWMIGLPGGPNLNVTVHNCGVLAGSALQLLGALRLLSGEASARPGRRGTKIVTLYCLVLILITALAGAALAGLLPVFFDQHAGPTTPRQLVLSVAVVFYGLSAGIVTARDARRESGFLHFTALSLSLIAVGLLSIFLQRRVGSPVGWLGRAAQYGGCVFALLAVTRAIGSARRKGIAPERMVRRLFQEAESSYRTLVETAADGVVTFDSDYRIHLWNGAAEKLLGYSRAEAVDASFVDLVLPEPSRAGFRAQAAALARGDAAAISPEGSRIQCRKRDGSLVPVEYSIAVRIVEDEQIGTCILRDIAERSMMEERLRRAHDELEARVSERTAELARSNQVLLVELTKRQRVEEELLQARKVESVGRLAGGVAHDFNNLLSPILGYSELLLADLAPGQPGREELEQIRKAAERARDLVRQLLAFGRKQLLSMEPHDLRRIVSELEPLLRRTIREDIAINIHLGEVPLTVRADAGQIEQVLINLAVNAGDAMPNGGTIIIDLAKTVLDKRYGALHPEVAPGAYASMTVSDTGLGMDEETRGHLFEPFYTTKEQGKGTGLGLSTAYGVVKQHGGHISVRSSPGRGSAFTIFVPLVEDPAGSGFGAAPADEGAPTGRETILVVEDSAAVRELTVKMLTRLGYRVIAAEAPEKSLGALLAEGGRVKVVLTDVVMPSQNGRDMYRRLAAAQPGLKVLYMSGYHESEIAHEGAPDRGIDFIQKPFSLATLGRKLRLVLDSGDGKGAA